MGGYTPEYFTSYEPSLSVLGLAKFGDASAGVVSANSVQSRYITNSIDLTNRGAFVNEGAVSHFGSTYHGGSTVHDGRTTHNADTVHNGSVFSNGISYNQTVHTYGHAHHHARTSLYDVAEAYANVTLHSSLICEGAANMLSDLVVAGETCHTNGVHHQGKVYFYRPEFWMCDPTSSNTFGPPWLHFVPVKADVVIDILWEDNSLKAVRKPGWLLVAGTGDEYTETIIAGESCPQQPIDGFSSQFLDI
jgi:hypothetical protein